MKDICKIEGIRILNFKNKKKFAEISGCFDRRERNSVLSGLPREIWFARFRLDAALSRRLEILDRILTSYLDRIYPSCLN